jgi:hypothetical protein
MGQPDAKRLQFSSVVALTSAINDDIQTLSDTALIKVGDVLEFYDQNASGCLESLVGTRTVTGVCPDTSITLDSAIDLTVITGTAAIRNRSIWTVEDAIKRLYECGFEAQDYKINWDASITSSLVDTPLVGQSTHSVSDASCWKAGDSWSIISDEGLAGSGVVVSIDAATNQVVIDSSIDTSVLTNPKLLNTSVDLKTQLMRLKEQIDLVGSPICEMLADGDCDNTVFYASQGMVQNSSQLYLDGNRKRKGTAGTRAGLVNDAGNAEITFASLVLGTDGNDIDIEFLDPAVPSSALSVSVTGTYDAADRKISVSLETDGGSSIISTAQEVAEAINADADAKRLVTAIYGGDGTGVQSALVATPLAGGLNDGTGDYVELQQVENNVLGAYAIVSFHIRPLEGNRMHCPPRESEELDLCFSRAL